MADRTRHALVLHLLEQLQILQADASVVVPHVAEVTRDHCRAVLRLAADAEVLAVVGRRVRHHVGQVVDRPQLDDCLGPDLPNGRQFAQTLQQVAVGQVGSIGQLVRVFDVALELV